MEMTAAAAELLARRHARKGLLAFTQYTHPRYSVGRPHRIIAEALDDVLIGKCDRLMICMPPRHGKSELASRRFPAFALGHYPHWQVISAGATQPLADEFGRNVRDIINGDECKAVFPALRLAEDSQARGRWSTGGGGAYRSIGVDGSIMGVGGDLIVIDDPYSSWSDAQSEASRNHVWEWYRNTIYNRMMPKARIVVINHRMHEDDLCGMLLAEEAKGGDKWRKVILPASTEGEALWPEAYDMDALERIKRIMSPVAYSALYMQEPTPDDGEYFKSEWWLEYSTVPTSLNTYISGDFAVTEGDGDFTSLIVWGVDHAGQVFALDRWTGQKAADTWIFELVRMMERWKPIAFIGEGGPIRRAVEPFLKRVMAERNQFTQVEWLTSGGDKASNARSFQAMMSCRRVFWPATSWAEAVKAQLLKFPGGKHDDDVDACGLFGRYISDVWAANRPNDPPKAINWDAPLKMGDVFGRKRRA